MNIKIFIVLAFLAVIIGGVGLISSLRSGESENTLYAGLLLGIGSIALLLVLVLSKRTGSGRKAR